MMNVEQYPREEGRSSANSLPVSSNKEQKKKQKKSLFGFIGRKKSKDKIDVNLVSTYKGLVC